MIKRTILLFIMILCAQFLLRTQTFRQYFQIFTDDVIQEIKCIEYENDTLGNNLNYKLSEDKTDIYLLNYNGFGKVKITYITASGEIREISRNKCNIHSLPEL